MENDKLLDSEDQTDNDIELEEIDDEVIDILKDLKFKRSPHSLNELQENLNLIRDRRANLGVLKYLRDKYIPMYDILLRFNPSDPDRPKAADFGTMPLEKQLKTLLVNAALHRTEVSRTYEKVRITELAKTSTFYAIGKKLGLAADDCGAVMLLFFGTIVIISFATTLWLITK
ncbi:hypothetical protein CLIB1444_17S00122 [[Candida] jaroonii]|uniref:Uncharacterized protein n=1 Tax=[Candida] jaroonii TaxID=467808 RepID=A0ACA9YER8_9ASCO|nr:hypothetical protein CLIB1444_17S00122 [[Candida] jaroonii]